MAIAALAGRQHGVVARWQLLAAGIGRGAVEHRLTRGRLLPVHRGVYAVGHAVLAREGHWLAATLAGGSAAVLSHRSAAALWGIRSTARERIEVTVAPGRRATPGIETRRSAIAVDERTTCRGIPVTTPARTLLDLAAVLRPPELERCLEQAEVRHLGDGTSLQTLLDRHRQRLGAAKLQAILNARDLGAGVTRSELEMRFLAFLRRSNVSLPEVNGVLDLADQRLEVDCLWRTERLVIELDGHGSHGTRAAYERDRQRDRLLQVHGWRVVRITWRQLHDEPARVASDLRRLVAGLAR